MSGRPPASPGDDPVAAAARLTGRTATDPRPMSGALTRLTLTDPRATDPRSTDPRSTNLRAAPPRSTGPRAAGGPVAAVVKRGDGPGAVAAEAAGLRWLAEADAVRVPAVLGADAHWLVTEHVPQGPPDARAAEEFGRDLAALHAAGAPAFGAPPPGGPREATIGRAPMRNETGPDWPSWYAEHRVLRYLRLAVDAGALRPAEAVVVERVCARLPELAGPAEPPARLHGDLWSGNVLWGADGAVRLIDPAAHGGHRETDLAMLRLFGCPHLDRVLAAYDEAAPLAAGWTARVPLHQLFPLLVHTVLFGRGYARDALAAARSALSS
ncbi:fructosamine kinase family protein [Actinacidiphila sp. DG2A-62]|uniref:fructosamine kinase family protein n=1 Tax=Actinacidiphila sp. DG2A-62 TaxID=3108821 RepID=UPI002DBD1D54|nr:fructosamine kinase family protein [Actinacidiphila sp. DG2A-62]MEC3998188.1 fructosamine kinase family protein [Actinacidiphila sp. DG2A-62]